jgi:hypothetical protein
VSRQRAKTNCALFIRRWRGALADACRLLFAGCCLLLLSRARSSIFHKLTDPAHYTGAHRHRFDQEGHGRGLAGRERIAKGTGSSGVAPYTGGAVHDLSQIVRYPAQLSCGSSLGQSPTPRSQ